MELPSLREGECAVLEFAKSDLDTATGDKRFAPQFVVKITMSRCVFYVFVVMCTASVCVCVRETCLTQHAAQHVAAERRRTARVGRVAAARYCVVGRVVER
jgi:hypothetical protein